MANAFLIMALVTSIYAILAVNFYACRQPEYFGSFSRALFTLFQICTGDGWARYACICVCICPCTCICVCIILKHFDTSTAGPGMYVMCLICLPHMSALYVGQRRRAPALWR